ncbi:hypothetical protein CYY_001353 [Polysphondylium violaceum]|uniref:Uncharacterized protein n=1 Tax=Polysphondylium violaceum TaxID=133409 RepID=A0A8J4Q267_9MYCE|nr:hypothetical protein CYY_001353 [Polysphondylium violaceum]
MKSSTLIFFNLCLLLFIVCCPKTTNGASGLPMVGVNSIRVSDIEFVVIIQNNREYARITHIEMHSNEDPIEIHGMIKKSNTYYYSPPQIEISPKGNYAFTYKTSPGNQLIWAVANTTWVNIPQY